KPEPIDVAMALDGVIASPDPAAAIEALAPNTPEYQVMRRALQYYHSPAAAAPQAAPAPRGVTGQRQAAKAPATPSATINQTRARQVAINLERLRWLPRSMAAGP